MFRRCLRWLAAGSIVALIAGVPAGYASYRWNTFRNFRVVQDGVLYRSGQMNLAGLERVVSEYGIRTVITLRDADRPGVPAPDLAEERWCLAQGLRYVRLSPKRWGPSDDGTPPAQKNINAFLAVMDDPANYPVLVHCFAGVHRTGAHVAVYRMEKQHWTNAEAIAEVKQRGYKNLDGEEDVLGYLETYTPRWKHAAAAPKK